MPTTLARWRESIFAPFDLGGGLFPFVAPEIRVEQVVEDGHYLIRAELPGVDPTKDIDVTVEHGLVSIQAERTEEKREKARSEFHYGKLIRTIPLPITAVAESAKATYANGILEIAFTMAEPHETGRHLVIDVAKESVKEVPKPKK
jgi:HSP20 family molecular chaperone IbpA